MNEKPVLSFCLIVGDAHVSLLPRCLKSIIDRPDGPLCDEIVIGFNGTDTKAFEIALRESDLGVVCSSDLRDDFDVAVEYSEHLPGRPRFVLHRGQNPKIHGFDKARQENFLHATGTWRCYLDVDDVVPLADDPQVVFSIQEGQVAGNDPSPTATLMEWLHKIPPYRNCILSPYDYVSSEKSRPLVRTRRPRIVRWDDHWVWESSVHEKLVHALGRFWPVYNPGFLVIHKPIISVEERAERNAAILRPRLEELKKEGQEIAYEMHYGLAELSRIAGDDLGAAESFEKAAETALDSEVRLYNYVAAVYAYIEAGQAERAARSALQALGGMPDRPEPYIAAAAATFAQGKYDFCLRWYEAGGTKPMPVGPMVDEVIQRLLAPVGTVGTAYLMQKRYKEALAVAERALEVSDIPIALKVKAQALAGLNPPPAPTPESSEVVQALMTELEDGEVVNVLIPRTCGASTTLAAVESAIQVNTLALQGESLLLQGKAHRPPLGKWTPDITFFCPVYAEPWGPWRIYRDGTGGSEESVVYLAKEFARRGLKVQVFAPLDPDIHGGVHVEDGVRWRTLDQFDTTTPLPGISISHRAPFAVGMPAFDLERLYIWHQDAWYQGSWNKEICAAVKHIYVSQWQANVLNAAASAKEAKGVISGNGIPASCAAWLGEAPKRDPYACVYLSSPIRGLVPLLDAWPRILEAHPEATLSVYYGWATSQVDSSFRESVMKKVIGTPGVIWKGRVPQAELERELPKAGVFLYPSIFAEGFCNAGIRATAAGLIPVYANLAALPEVQYPSEFAFDEDPRTPEGADVFVKQAVKALKASETANTARVGMANWALEKHDWVKVADRILADFKKRGL